MKEKFHDQSESGHEHLPDAHETVEARNESLSLNSEAVEVHNHNIDKLQESIHETALSTDEITIEQHDHSASKTQPVLGIQRELKSDAYNKTIRKVRSNLAPFERSFSKLIHHKALEPISEVGSKTVARPSGILGGGIVALIGSAVVLYMAKRYGFQYNLSIFFILLGAGFFTGLLAELGAYFFNRSKT